MRLVIDGQRLTARRTGVGRCLEALLADWDETAWPLDETVLVVRDPNGLDRVPVAEGLTTVIVGQGWPGLIWETFGLGRILKPDDLLFAPANLVPLNWRGTTVAVLYDTLPWAVPESFSWHVRLRFGWRYGLAARRASRIVVPSESTARDVARVHKIPAERIRVAYPGPEPRFRPMTPDAPEVIAARRAVGLGSDPYFLFVGKRSRRRNVPAICEAFAAHRSRFPGHRLVFVGPEDGEALPGEASGITKAGFVSDDVLHALLAGARALLYSSDYEGFGLPVVEAQATGCPVITLRNSALVESAGEAAWYLDSSAPPAIVRALEALGSDRALRDDLVARGFANVARFDRGQFAEGVKNAIRDVARETGTHSRRHGIGARQGSEVIATSDGRPKR